MAEQENKLDVLELVRTQQAQIREMSEQMAARLTEAKQLLLSNSLSPMQTKELLKTIATLKNKLQILKDKNDEINQIVGRIRQVIQDAKDKALSQAKTDE